MEQNSHPGKGHETTDAAVKPILYFLIGLGALIVVVMALMTVLYNVLETEYGRADAEVSPLIDAQQIPPGPKLQAYPAEDLGELHEWEEERLNSYEWVDENTGIFRIPIDRAIEIVAESGLPARERGPGTSTEATEEPSSSE